MPGGELVVHEDGVGIRSNTGEPFLIAKGSRCDECCEADDGYGCEMWFCGCSCPDNEQIKSLYGAQWTQGMSRPVSMRRPEFLQYPGLCSRTHSRSHAGPQNSGNEMADTFTTHRYVCNDDGTATLDVQNIVYNGNNTIDQNNVKNKWRFNGYTSTGWPLLDNRPRYDISTGKLHVQIKWTDILTKYEVEINFYDTSGLRREFDVPITMDSYTGTGTASFDPVPDIATVDEPDEGPLNGDFVFDVPAIPPDVDEIEVICRAFQEGAAPRDRPTLTSVLILDYYHEIVGTDSATITFDPDFSDRCGFCTNYEHAEITFTTAVSEWSVMLMGRGGGEKEYGGHIDSEYWCGCGSEPQNEDVNNPSTLEENEFYVNPKPKRFGRTLSSLYWSGFISRSTDRACWPINSDIGDIYGWSVQNNDVSRELKYKEVPEPVAQFPAGFLQQRYPQQVIDGCPNKYNAPPMENVNTLLGYLPDDQLGPFHPWRYNSDNGPPGSEVPGGKCFPRLPHPGDDTPYSGDYWKPFFNDDYNKNQKDRLGTFRAQAYLEPDQFPSLMKNWYGTSRRLEYSFKMKYHYYGRGYWAVRRARRLGENRLVDSLYDQVGRAGVAMTPFTPVFGGTNANIAVGIQCGFLSNPISWADGPAYQMFSFGLARQNPQLWGRYLNPHEYDGFSVIPPGEYFDVQIIHRKKFYNSGTYKLTIICNNQVMYEVDSDDFPEDRRFSHPQLALYPWTNWHAWNCYGAGAHFEDRPCRSLGHSVPFGMTTGVPFIKRRTFEVQDFKIEYFNTF